MEVYSDSSKVAGAILKVSESDVQGKDHKMGILLSFFYYVQRHGLPIQ